MVTMSRGRRQGPVGDRLKATSWNIDVVLPPSDDEEMVYEDLPPVAAAIQGEVVLNRIHKKSNMADTIVLSN